MDNSLLAVRDINHKYIVVEGKFLEGLGGFLGVLGFCSRLSNFVEIRRKFLWCNFQYMYCIYFHIMLLLVYRICMSAMAISLFLF